MDPNALDCQLPAVRGAYSPAAATARRWQPPHADAEGRRSVTRGKSRMRRRGRSPARDRVDDLLPHVRATLADTALQHADSWRRARRAAEARAGKERRTHRQAAGDETGALDQPDPAPHSGERVMTKPWTGVGVFPAWLTQREDFQDVFPRFSKRKVGGGPDIPLMALKKSPEDRSDEDKARLAQWIADSPIGTVSNTGADGLAKCRALAKVIFHRELEPSEVLFYQGDVGDAFYMIYKGRVTVMSNGIRLAELGEGASFGEKALVREEPRNATIQAVEKTGLIALRKKDYKETLTTYQEAQTNAFIDFLHRSSTLFRSWSRTKLRQLASCLVFKRMRAQEYVVRQGSPVDSLYFLYRGECLVQKEFTHRVLNRWPSGVRDWETKVKEYIRPLALRRLLPGDHFGEELLFGLQEREFTVVANHDVEVLVLNQEDSRKLLDGQAFRAIESMFNRLRQSVDKVHSLAEAKMSLARRGQTLKEQSVGPSYARRAVMSHESRQNFEEVVRRAALEAARIAPPLDVYKTHVGSTRHRELVRQQAEAQAKQQARQQPHPEREGRGHASSATPPPKPSYSPLRSSAASFIQPVIV